MTSDWRDASAYDYLDTLDAGDLAWECLRRNPAYRRAYPSLRDGEASSLTWGLRFPGRSGAEGPRGKAGLDPG